MTDIHEELFKMYHWVFLALPPPLPETLIAASYKFYYQHTIESWTGSRYKGKMNAEATSHWIEQYQDPKVIEGSCEEYAVQYIATPNVNLILSLQLSSRCDH